MLALLSKLPRTMRVFQTFAYTRILSRDFTAVQQARTVVGDDESAKQELGLSSHLSSPSAPLGSSVIQT